MINYNTILLTLAVLPAIVLMVYIYRQDTQEKEPIGMLLRALLLGILSTIPAAFIENILTAFSPSNELPIANGLFNGFVVAGLTEELCKMTALTIAVWRSRYFDEYFDGIVYATFVSLGFAGLENVMYVFSQSTFSSAIATGTMRAILSVPAHFLFGVAMGYYFALARFRPAQRSKYLALALLVPALLHGTFDALLMIPENMEHQGLISSILFLAFLWFDLRLWKYGKRRLQQLQQLGNEAAAQTTAKNYSFEEEPPAQDHHFKDIDDINW